MHIQPPETIEKRGEVTPPDALHVRRQSAGGRQP